MDDTSAGTGSTEPSCDFHPGATVVPDTYGHWYCPDCDDEAHANRTNKGPGPQPVGGIPIPPHYAAGGPLPPGPDSLVPPALGCSGGITERAMRASGQGTVDWLALLNSDGTPKAAPLPAADAVAQAVSRQRGAEHQKTEAATRAALRDIVREKIGLHLEGHRGVVKQLRAAVYDTAADAAIDAFLAAVSAGQIQHIVTDGSSPVRPGVIIVDGVEYVPREPELPPDRDGFGWSAHAAMQERH